ncbi:hypothetical protein E2C01_079930 [Portunus trituberculatus]|uniref:Uncharacterized protein n=1 Tax=Portunus trituberculatus TaxID=210409 RepID=A0A5B7IUM5_PORTR|nr:hypothetical protein [Portunus trituberculatus]
MRDVDRRTKEKKVEDVYEEEGEEIAGFEMTTDVESKEGTRGDKGEREGERRGDKGKELNTSSAKPCLNQRTPVLSSGLIATISPPPTTPLFLHPPATLNPNATICPNPTPSTRLYSSSQEAPLLFFFSFRRGVIGDVKSVFWC